MAVKRAYEVRSLLHGMLSAVAARIALQDWSFRRKLATAALALSLVPTILAATLLAWQADHQAASTRAATAATQVRTAATLAGILLDDELRLVQGLATSGPTGTLAGNPSPVPSLRRADRARVTLLLATAIKSTSSLTTGASYLTSRHGVVLASAGPAAHAGRAALAFIVRSTVASGGPVALLMPGTGNTLLIAAPVVHGTTVAGAVVGEFSPTALWAALAASNSTLVLASGRTINGHTPLAAPALLAGSPLPATTASDPALAALNAAGPLQVDDSTWAMRVSPDLPLVVRTSPDQDSGSLLAGGVLQIALLLLMIFTVASAIWFTILLSRPLSLLASTLTAVRAGDYNVRVPLWQKDEIGQIAGAVNMLIARTQALVTDLENRRIDLENGIIQLFTELAEAASGDLTIRPTMTEGSLGAVADSMSIVLDRFHTTVKSIQATAGAVTSGTSDMAATVLRVSQESRNQAAQLATGAAAIAEMADSAQSVSERTHAATNVAAQAVDAVESGNKAVTYARDAVKRTLDTSKRATRQVKSLGESAQLMGNALLLVQHNTEELHLIAGNASIEAARYAENGGVFRGVADAIEQLAQQSQVALRQIQNVVENTQRETSRVVTAIEEVTGEVGNVARAVNLAGENFDTINHVVQRLADLNIFIASASEQQAEMAAHVAEVIGTLNQISVQTSMNTAASAEAAVRLSRLTEQLNDSVSTLKVS